MIERSVDLPELRIFLVLCEELHFGRAAERVGLTPSRVSQTIRTLETRLGGRLFDRTSRRVALTALGEQLRDDAQPALLELERALTRAKEAASGITGTLSLGMYSPVNGGPDLVEIVRRFQDRHLGCSVRVVDTGFERDQLDWLRTGEVDLLAMRLPVGDPAVTIGPVLSRERRMVAVSTNHPLAGRQSICLEDLAEYPVSDIATLPREMMESFIPPTAPSGRPIRRIMVRTIAESLARVALGETIHPTVESFLEHSRHPNITAIPIADLPPSETALIWATNCVSSKIQAFASVAEEVSRVGDHAARGVSWSRGQH
jgi:DNA-binding transcriptional LysR family regulator